MSNNPTVGGAEFVALTNVAGSAVDLTGAVITVRMLRMETGTEQVLPAQLLTGSNAAQGLVQHLWLATETAIPGAYFYHWIVTWTTPPRAESFPNDSRGLVLSIEA
jgi:hypothetical protein